jgi:aspartyl/asparaginyl beta-hydroxylase (cupin superfamily)
MSNAATNPLQLTQAAQTALRRGQLTEARKILLEMVQSGAAAPPDLLTLGTVCHQLGDLTTAAGAIDRLLGLDPRNFRGLVLRGDLLTAAGDVRSASAFYATALRVAPPANQLALEAAQDLRRVQAIVQKNAADYQAFLLERLAAAGFDASRSSSRFAQSVDLILGKRRVYLQEPKVYYFPGLPQIQFYGREPFPWLDKLEDATEAIRAELRAVMGDPQAFAPYVTGDANRPRKDQAGMLNNPAWSAFYLWKNGEAVAGNAERCPATLAALADVPLARVPNRSPSILFSLLKPGAHIPPHNGLVNTRLICHLPLIVPGPCRFRVGSEVREWREGEAWLFDDTIEHEAWNTTQETRVILLFDVWRPELLDEEQKLVVSLFEAIDAHAGKKPEWEI